ncbi:hypothetical protein ANCDUO_20313 [Ancylostoma duodenale]|uniref:Uncharacterized protein n=1 Tax=Ancylostoma duodenale TaxID=51022 RepID=A0A0C2C053_9BILA|nr:hypothetical protein ANCDUO_20313 [Ancylostoma duodenale]
MKLNVEFEVVKEVGPPHDRSYVVRCSLRNPKNEKTSGREWISHQSNPICESMGIFQNAAL